MIRMDLIAQLYDVFYMSRAPEARQRLPDPCDEIAYVESKSVEGLYLVPVNGTWKHATRTEAEARGHSANHRGGTAHV